MKSITTSLLLLTGILSAFSAQKPSLPDRIAEADLIAIMSVTNVTKTVSTNADGSHVVAFFADASVERTLKGAPRESIRVKDETTGTAFSADDLYRSADPQLSSRRLVGTRRFVVLLKASGDSFTPLGSDCVAGVYGEGSARDRIAWGWGCPTLDEAVASIQKILKSEIPAEP